MQDINTVLGVLFWEPCFEKDVDKNSSFLFYHCSLSDNTSYEENLR